MHPISRPFRAHWPVFALIAAAVATAAVVLVLTGAVSQSPRALSAGILADFVITVPIAYWLLIVRTGRAPARTVIPVIAAGLLVASQLLPQTQAGLVQALRWLLLPAEVVLLGFIAWKIRTILRARTAGAYIDPLDAITGTLQRSLGNPIAARLIAAEFATIYFALGFGRHGQRAPQAAKVFPSPGQGRLLAVLTAVAALETVLVHILVSLWSPAAAWVLTGLSLYTIFWLVGDHRAITRRPTYLTATSLHIRLGMRCSLAAPLEAVAAAVPLGWQDAGKRAKGVLNLASPDTPNVEIRFSDPLAARRYFGIVTRHNTVRLRVHDPDALLRALAPTCGSTRPDIQAPPQNSR